MPQRFFSEWAKIREPLALLMVLGMIAGFMWSRALLSTSLIIGFINIFHPSYFIEEWTIWRKNKIALACFLFFLCYAISGIWSEDLGHWWSGLQNKLPFGFLPFMFLGLHLEKPKNQKLLVNFLLLNQFLVICYSLTVFVSNWSYYLNAYNYSVSLPTTKYNDHIRFSLSLVASLIMLFYYLFKNKRIFNHKWERSILWALVVLFIAYLHLLASKTGLLVLYISLLVFVWDSLRHLKPVGLAYLFLGLMLLCPFILYWTIPTFQTKVDYVRYEYRQVKEHDQLDPNLSDAGRLISYQMAFQVWREHLWLGTGSGDLSKNMSTAYQQLRPDIPEKNHINPHNQYLYTFVSLGIILGSCIFVLLFASYFSPYTFPLGGKLNSIIMAVAMMAEAMLEIQFGIFLFLLYLLYWENI